MRAYKCDRCGQYFDISYKYDNTKVCLSILAAGRWTTADLCKDCMHSLEDWHYIHKLLNKEVEEHYEMDKKTVEEIQGDERLEEAQEDET